MQDQEEVNHNEPEKKFEINLLVLVKKEVEILQHVTKYLKKTSNQLLLLAVKLLKWKMLRKDGSFL